VNVVFDFGGVLFDWRPAAFLARLLPEEAGDAASAQALAECFFQGYGGDWAEFDRGAVDESRLAQRIARRTGLSVAQARRVIDAVPHELQPIPGTVELLRQLHGCGQALYFLSNMPAPYASHLERTHDFLGLFRDGVFSARAGLIKPEEAIYRHAERALGLTPARTLFIDDVLHNVEAARTAGWQAVHFSSPEQCAQELAAHGLL
jgi:putative hydrolase of the HAD superfamily